MTRRTIVLDANILIRAVPGQRVRQLIMDHVADVTFFAPDSAFDEAREHLPGLLEKRASAVLPRLPCWMHWRTSCDQAMSSCYGPLERSRADR